MLSSLILSLAMSASPTADADVNKLEVQETATSRRGVRILDNKLETNKTATSRRGVRIQDNKLDVNKTATSRRGVRI